MLFPRYKVELIGMVESKDNYQSLAVTPVTLLTRFGGIIGVGKNLLGII